MPSIGRYVRGWFSREEGASDHLLARWLFLRALGLIYFSAFYPLLFQIRGLMGPNGILPAQRYLTEVQGSLDPLARLWFAPTLLWFGGGSAMLLGLVVAGLLASLLVIANIAPRPALFACFVCFLSFVAAAQDFSGYQSDGMLLEAGFLSLFVAPTGLRPGWGRRSLPVRAAVFLLLWECFRIYFESGVVKLASGDPTWRNFTAMDEYYQNGPLPTWIGWYLQHLPHSFHAASAALTLVMELVLVWAMFLPRRWRIGCFFLLTAWQAVVILTANYTFLNYLVLVLALLLLDDRFFLRCTPKRGRERLASAVGCVLPGEEDRLHEDAELPPRGPAQQGWRGVVRSIDAMLLRVQTRLALVSTATAAIILTWIFYATLVPLVGMTLRVPLPARPVQALEPFRIANRYGLFAVMTPHRYEIEFQGSEDGGRTWVSYPFRYKPQDVRRAPGIYAPYQPRFDWNLWFCSLTSWRDCAIVPRTEELLLAEDRDVLTLFAADPFRGRAPGLVRAVLYQYWFSSMTERRSGVWWRRELLGTYAPTLARATDGEHFVIRAEPDLPLGAPQ